MKTETSKVNDYQSPKSNARMLRERRNVLIGLTADMIIFSDGSQQTRIVANSLFMPHELRVKSGFYILKEM